MVLNSRMDVATDRYLLFEAAGATWGMAMSDVAEVLPLPRLERPAGSPSVLAGFMNLGGEAVPVIRAAALFGGGQGEGEDLYSHIIRLSHSSGRAQSALLVDRVSDVEARAEGLAPLDEDQSVNGALEANLLIDGRLVPLVDAGKLLLLEEERRVQELAQAAQARLAELDDAGA